MDHTLNQVIVIFTGIIGVAILAVLVSRNSNTSQVIGATFGGFAQALSAAEAPVTGSNFGPTGGFTGLGYSSALGGF